MKTQTPLNSIFGTAFIALLLLMVPCNAASNPSALVGRWVGVSGEDKDGVLDLLSDGTGVLSKGSLGVAITWKTENGRFYTIASGAAVSQSYKLQGSVLTFTDDNGKISEYAKCNKDCQEVAKEYAKATAEKAAAILKAEAAEAKAKVEKAAAALKAKAKKGSFTDSRDGKTYKTVKLDNQTWMAENLNYNANDSKCYENQESNCQKYGRLYNWSTAKSACPSGWHLPSKDEWQVLVDLAGGDKVAGNMLKASSGWNKDGNGMDAVGFSALPGGNGSSDGYFLDVGIGGFWWSAAEHGANDAYYRFMDNYENVFSYNRSKDYLRSVRCLQD